MIVLSAAKQKIKEIKIETYINHSLGKCSHVQKGVKLSYCGHVVLQQLCSGGAELSFTRRLRLRGSRGGG